MSQVIHQPIAVLSLGTLAFAGVIGALMWKSKNKIRSVSVSVLVEMYGSSSGGEDAAGSELKRRGASANVDVIQMLDAIESPELQADQISAIVRILENVLPSEESYSALERCRSRMTHPARRERFAVHLAALRARLSGRWNEDWWKVHRAMSPGNADLHYRELLLASAQPSDSVSFLVDAARSASRAGDDVKSEAYARELIAIPNLATKSGDGVYHANQILGTVALQRGDIAGAKHHLIESAKASGLSVGGPSFKLAESLLDRGEHDAVLEYLELCKAFLGHEVLIEKWRTSIRDGATPNFRHDWREASINDQGPA